MSSDKYKKMSEKYKEMAKKSISELKTKLVSDLCDEIEKEKLSRDLGVDDRVPRGLMVKLISGVKDVCPGITRDTLSNEIRRRRRVKDREEKKREAERKEKEKSGVVEVVDGFTEEQLNDVTFLVENANANAKKNEGGDENENENENEADAVLAIIQDDGEARSSSTSNGNINATASTATTTTTASASTSTSTTEAQKEIQTTQGTASSNSASAASTSNSASIPPSTAATSNSASVAAASVAAAPTVLAGDSPNSPSNDNPDQPKKSTKKRRRSYLTAPTTTFDTTAIPQFSKRRKRRKNKSDHELALQSTYDALTAAKQTKLTLQSNVDNLERQLQILQKHVDDTRRKLDDAKRKLSTHKEVIDEAAENVTQAELKLPTPWNKNYAKLKQYYDTHGNIELPTRCHTDKQFDSLCIWVNAQKANYHKYCDGTVVTKKPYKVAALEKLGIRWHHRCDKWDENYRKLLKYMEENGGSTVVPTKSHPDRNFSNWVVTQRYMYKVLQDQIKRKERRRKERENRMSGGVSNVEGGGGVIGEPNNRSSNDGNHTNDPNNNNQNSIDENGNLSEEDSDNDEEKNVHTVMTPERIEKLNQIGFVWNVFDEKWKKMYQELLDYRDEFGHVDVPARFSKNGPLCNWVKRQRLEYGMIQRGEGNSLMCKLTEERIELLEEIGFKFEVEAAV